MKILLHPDDDRQLETAYTKALSSAVELSILSAYLTTWDHTTKLSSKCIELNFIVGTDFGITRKDACYDVLKWLPRNFKNDFLAADDISGFHPKLALWKSANSKYYIILGSSNLTKAAFSKNFEANIISSITRKEYSKIKEWIYQIRNECLPISEDWLDSYKELERKFMPTKKKTSATEKTINLRLPKGKSIDDAILHRRKQDKAFKSIKKSLIELMTHCANGKISNKTFYKMLMELWGYSDSRLQGRGFEISGKHANWKEICNSLITIINSKSTTSSPTKLDNIVKHEIDSLALKENPLRRSWFSEMLCHFFPERYPLDNGPVLRWLKHNKYCAPRKSSQGSRYIDLSIKLRTAIKNNDSNKARNLSELDHAIWRWVENNKPRGHKHS
jgi:hypothetical protein